MGRATIGGPDTLDFLFNLLPHVVNGLSLGLLFALIALGFMLIIGVMELINLAHGSLFALGAYMAMLVIRPDAPWLDAWLALPLTFGAALVLEEAIRLIWGPLEQIMPVPDQVSGAFIAGGLIWSTYRFFAVALALAVILLVWLFLERTPYGAMIKAGAHDAEMVQALGINLVRLRLFVFALGTALAAIAGIIMTPIWGLRPTVGIDAVIPAFLIIVLGGIGSFWGAVIAGVLVGLAVGLTGAYASEWSLLSMYLLLIAVVTFRARGLLGKKSVLEAPAPA